MTTDKVAAIDIPTGKAVERIEAKEIDGKIVITVLYKEDKPKKNKPVAVLCETDAHTCLYHDSAKRKVVMFMPGVRPDAARYVPVRSAKEGEFAIIPAEVVDKILLELATEINEVCDTHSDSFAHAEAVLAVRRQWEILHKLLAERK